MDGTSTVGNLTSAEPVSQVGDLVIDTLRVSLEDENDGVSAAEQAALQSAIAMRWEWKMARRTLFWGACNYLRPGGS